MIEETLNIPVSEIMSFPVNSVNKDTTIYEVANILKDKNIGAVIVVDENNKPIGIITERDIIKKVVAKNLKPKDVKVEEVMRKKVITIEYNKPIKEAAELMAKYNIKRLPVVKDGSVIGIVTQSDIVRIAPRIIDIILEYSKYSSSNIESEKEEVIEGICESCGNYGILRYYNGRYLCEDCLDEYNKD